MCMLREAGHLGGTFHAFLITDAGRSGHNHRVILRPSIRLLAPALALVAGCTIEGALGRDPAEYHVVADVPPDLREQLDLLFVVDTTQGAPVMEARATAALADLRAQLVFVNDRDFQLRVGVVSADVGVAGVSGCADPASGGALIPPTGDVGTGLCRADGSWLTCDPPDGRRPDNLAQAFAAVHVPPSECGYPQPLNALARVVDPSTQFVRPGAALGVVVIAGRDDCSAGSDFYDPAAPDPTLRCFQEGVTCTGDDVGEGGGRCQPRQQSRLVSIEEPTKLVGNIDPEAVVVAGAVGDADRVTIQNGGDQPELLPACAQDGADIYPAVRLSSFVQSFAHHAIAPLCQADGPGLGTPTGHELRRVLGSRCLSGRLRDIEPDIGGMQWDCLVTAVGPGEQRTPLPACRSQTSDYIKASDPCFRISMGGHCGDADSGFEVSVNWGRAGGRDPQQAWDDTRTEVSCLLADAAP